MSGQHFTDGAVIHVGGVAAPTAFVDASTLTGSIAAATLDAGAHAVTVHNPDGQVGEAQGVEYVAQDPAPGAPGFQSCVRYAESVDFLCRELGLRCAAPPGPPPGLDCGGRCNENAHLTWPQDQCAGAPNDHRGCGEPGRADLWVVPYCVAP